MNKSPGVYLLRFQHLSGVKSKPGVCSTVMWSLPSFEAGLRSGQAFVQRNSFRLPSSLKIAAPISFQNNHKRFPVVPRLNPYGPLAHSLWSLGLFPVVPWPLLCGPLLPPLWSLALFFLVPCDARTPEYVNNRWSAESFGTARTSFLIITSSLNIWSAHRRYSVKNSKLHRKCFSKKRKGCILWKKTFLVEVTESVLKKRCYVFRLCKTIVYY